MHTATPPTLRLRFAAIRRFPGQHRLAALLASLAFLSACGGGGGDTPAPPPDGLPDLSSCVFPYTLTSAEVLTGTDPRLADQWHLDNTGQTGGTPSMDLRAFGAWTLTRGEGARVAVVDDAIEVLHEDLAPNVVAGASYSYRPGAVGSVYPLPCEADDDHGTAVAGIAAARDGNGRGVAGVAPRAGLVGYDALATGYEADIADALTRGAPENGVYNNSWGSPDDGTVSPSGTVFTQSIETGIAQGRGGKGAVYVFAGGNGGLVGETAGLDGYLNHRGVIAACGVDHDGRVPDFGEPGANLLVCGFSAAADFAGSPQITTTALQDGYRSDFRGTSGSAPMVSGVAALILSANPGLSWRDVRLILAHSARRPPYGSWVPGPEGLAFDHHYGFGVADAKAAVDAARSWTSVGGSDSLVSCGPYLRSPRAALPDATGAGVTMVEDRVDVGAECGIRRIEYVEIGFTASHAYSGDLRVRLLSPGGLESRLVDERKCIGDGDACGAYQDWRFGSVRHLEEAAGGRWVLQVGDAQPGNTGTWQAWSLRFWGR